MSLIEGIGDELTITVSIFVVFITLFIAWMSTRVSENRIAQAQLSGLHWQIHDPTQSDQSQSEEEQGSSVESIEVDNEQTVNGTQQQATNESQDDSGNGPLRELSREPPGQNVPSVGETSSGSEVGGHIESTHRRETSSSTETKDDDNNTSGGLRKTTGEDATDNGGAKIETLGQDGDHTNTAEGATFSDEISASQLSDSRTSSGSDISLKIKFLNETERVVQTSIEETVGNFKRLNFADESRDGKVVHLIFNGQFLRDDSRDLGSYSIVNNCVIHCHISQQRQSPGTAAQQEDQGELDLGQCMVPLFAGTIGFVWYLRWQYSYMFNTMSTMSLSAVTALFMLAVLAAWRG